MVPCAVGLASQGGDVRELRTESTRLFEGDDFEAALEHVAELAPLRGLVVERAERWASERRLQEQGTQQDAACRVDALQAGHGQQRLQRTHVAEQA